MCCAAADLLEGAKRFIFTDAQLKDSLQECIADACHGLGANLDVTDAVHHSLECTQYHEQYCRLLESRLEGFLRAEGASMEAFVCALRRSRGSGGCGGDIDAEEEAEVFVEALLAMQDFSSFMVMLRETRRGNPVRPASAPQLPVGTCRLPVCHLPPATLSIPLVAPAAHSRIVNAMHSRTWHVVCHMSEAASFAAPSAVGLRVHVRLLRESARDVNGHAQPGVLKTFITVRGSAYHAPVLLVG